MSTITPADFDAVACGPRNVQGDCTRSGYLAHVQINAPRYALVPIRAEVDGGELFDWEGGSGWTCYYVNLLVRWQSLGCAETWAA